jgi:hypothetical protein
MTKVDKDEQDYEVLYDGTIKHLRIQVVRNENREWCIIESPDGNRYDVCVEDLSVIAGTLLYIVDKFTGNPPATSAGPWRKEY